MCRDVLRRWFHGADGVPVNFDRLPDADRLEIIAAAESMKTKLGATFAIEEAYRSQMTSRLDLAEGLAGPHGGET